ncbi:MAG: TIR domain-containing protein [Anaerolineae bacterium]|nr:TIR domain-containing protein [Anaerolineae bacterium]
MITMPHIFISYAKKDTRPLAEAIYNALNAIPGLTAWMDTSLEPGKSWEDQIQREIDRADLVVVLLSEDINREETEDKERSFVLTEIAYAKQVKKQIVPVRVHKINIPLGLTRIQYIDLTATPNDPTKVIEDVCKRFEISYIPSPRAFVSVSPSPTPAKAVSRAFRGRSGLTFGVITVLVIAVAVALSVSRNSTNPPDVTQTAARTATEVAQVVPSATVTFTPSPSPTATSQPTETVVPIHTPSPTETPRPSDTAQPTSTPTPLPATSTFTPSPIVLPTDDPCLGRIHNSNFPDSSVTYYRQPPHNAPALIDSNTVVRVVGQDFMPGELFYYKIEFGDQSGYVLVEYVADVTRDCPHYVELELSR